MTFLKKSLFFVPQKKRKPCGFGIKRGWIKIAAIYFWGVNCVDLTLIIHACLKDICEVVSWMSALNDVCIPVFIYLIMYCVFHLILIVHITLSSLKLNNMSYLNCGQTLFSIYFHLSTCKYKQELHLHGLVYSVAGNERRQYVNFFKMLWLN